jgi:hypothetical protein
VPDDTRPPEAATGPFLQFACFCETVIEGKDGTISLIRVVDQVMQTATGTDVPEQMPPFGFQLKLVIGLRAGKARGRYAIKIQPEDPSGAQLPGREIALHLEGSHRGANFLTDLNFIAQLEGVYWFDVILVRGQGEEVLLTRVPLEVKYQPEKLPSPPA